MLIRYQSLGDYIRTRAMELGLNTSSLVEALNRHQDKVSFGVSYVNSIVNGQFTPSKKRCLLIADFFDDDPNIILQLAGYYSPPEDTALIEAIAGGASQLNATTQHLVVALIYFLRDHFASCHKGGDNEGCLMLPSGAILPVDVPPNVSDDMIQAVINSALSELRTAQ